MDQCKDSSRSKLKKIHPLAFGILTKLDVAMVRVLQSVGLLQVPKGDLKKETAPVLIYSFINNLRKNNNWNPSICGKKNLSLQLQNEIMCV